MADSKKTTASKAPKTTKKSAVKKVNLHEAKLEDLEKQLVAKTNDLLEAKRSHHSGELVNPKVLNVTRKEIARLKTIIKQKQSAKEETK